LECSSSAALVFKTFHLPLQSTLSCQSLAGSLLWWSCIPPFLFNERHKQVFFF
jgi:hypothetical protein